MKPRLLTILLLLLAGAVVNVGVAWGWMRWGPEPQVWGLAPQHRAEQFWPDSSLRPSVNDPIWGTGRSDGTGRMKFIGAALRRAQPGSAKLRWELLEVDRAGLPVHALEVRRTWSRSDESALAGLVNVNRGRCGLAPAPAWPPRGSGLMVNLDEYPVRPIWRGIAVNTLAYAGAWWLLSLAPPTLRRHLRARRARRGLCPACGYPVGEAAVCSECGKAVRSRRPSAT